MEFENYISKLE